MAGVTKSTKNPPGGTFDRDEKGELNGRVTDRARSVFNNVGKRPTFTAGADANSAAGTASRTSRSSSSATA